MGWIRWLKSLFAPDAPTPLGDTSPPSPPPPAPPPPPPSPPAPPRVWPAALGETIVGVDGALLGATPACDVSIQGVPCRAGALVTFAPNGRLTSATLARAHDIGGEALAAGAVVRLDPDGTLRAWGATLAAPRRFTARGADASTECDVDLAADTRVEVEWGRLRRAILSEGVTIDGWSFAANTELVWGDSGALSHATSPDVMTLAGVRWAPHETVVFEFGRLREGYPDEDGALDGVPYQRGEIVRLHDNGRVARCHLAADLERSGVPCASGARVYLDDQGGLLEGTLARDAVLGEVPVAAGTVVCASNGVVVSLTPQTDCEVDGVWCAAGEAIARSEGGRLLRATLARERTVQGVEAPAGSVVVWRGDGAPWMLVMTDGRASDGRRLDGTWTILWGDDGAVRHALPTTPHSRPDAVSLREVATLDGVRVAARTMVELSPHGALRSAVLAADQPLGGLVGKAETRARWDDDGALVALTLAKDTRIGAVVCAGGATLGAVMNDVERSYHEHVQLHPQGIVAFATLAEDARVSGVPLVKGSTVVCLANGSLSVGTLADAWTLPTGHVAARGALLGLFDDGTPSLLTLAEPYGAHAVGTVLRYTAPGVLAGATEPVSLDAITLRTDEETRRA